MHQPDPEKKPDPLAGIIALRHMHIRAIEETGMTAADEMLYPENLPYVEDFLSYIAIGARSVENQQHRLVSLSLIHIWCFVHIRVQTQPWSNEFAHACLYTLLRAELFIS